MSPPGAPAPGLDRERWARRGVLLLPIQHDTPEITEAVRAELDAYRPSAVVLEIPAPLEDGYTSALTALPRIHALCVERPGSVSWLVAHPLDPLVEAGRWALENGAALRCADLLLGDYPRHREALPDPAVVPEIGYGAWAEHVAAALADHEGEGDAPRETALAAAALEAAEGGERVALICGAAHASRLLGLLERGAAQPLVRPAPAKVSVHALHPECLVEILPEAPFVAAAWERARGGGSALVYTPPRQPPEKAAVLHFPGAEPAPTEAHEPEPSDEKLGSGMPTRGRLGYELVRHAMRFAHETSGSVPSLAERRVLHRYARNMAGLEGRFHPDLFELVIAARGCVDDRFARDLLAVAGHWPWARPGEEGVRLSPEDLGLGSRLVQLRPRIDRLARRPSLRRVLRAVEKASEAEPGGICSHPPEDLVIEAVGAELRSLGRRRAHGAGLRIEPFTGSLLDGIDFRETLRRFVVDPRPWVREHVSARSDVGAVVILFDEEDEAERFPWCEVWHGEYDEESDMAFYATDPRPGVVAPGIHRAEYGGYLLIWPPRRLGDVWHDPAYHFCESPGERLLVAGLDYANDNLVVYVARERPRATVRSLARRLGKRIVHVPPGVLSRDKRRRLQLFHVLANRALRPLAGELLREP